MKGSPSGKFSGQEQMGLCPETWHRASSPQLLMHGSLHFLLIQALFAGQSEFTAHSGRQAGGVPRYPVWHEHTARSLDTWHSLFTPHGDGSQGLLYAKRKMETQYLKKI